MSLAGNWAAVLGLRFVDRVGKGIRSAPQDALIATVTPAGHRGRGDHRPRGRIPLEHDESSLTRTPLRSLGPEHRV